jgi:hypothetical protein
MNNRYLVQTTLNGRWAFRQHGREKPLHTSRTRDRAILFAGECLALRGGTLTIHDEAGQVTYCHSWPEPEALKTSALNVEKVGRTVPEFKFRKKGLPKRIGRVTPLVLTACDINLGVEDGPLAKVCFFRNKKDLRDFYANVFPNYVGEGFSDRLCRRTRAVVSKMSVEKVSLETLEIEWSEVDRRYFCFVGLVLGHLTAEVLCHEAVHVGFAWDYRTQGKSKFSFEKNEEENVCYPAGIFVDQVLTFIKAEGLREL